MTLIAQLWADPTIRVVLVITCAALVGLIICDILEGGSDDCLRSNDDDN